MQALWPSLFSVTPTLRPSDPQTTHLSLSSSLVLSGPHPLFLRSPGENSHLMLLFAQSSFAFSVQQFLRSQPSLNLSFHNQTHVHEMYQKTLFPICAQSWSRAPAYAQVITVFLLVQVGSIGSWRQGQYAVVLHIPQRCRGLSENMVNWMYLNLREKSKVTPVTKGCRKHGEDRKVVV